MKEEIYETIDLSKLDMKEICHIECKQRKLLLSEIDKLEAANKILSEAVELVLETNDHVPDGDNSKTTARVKYNTNYLRSIARAAQQKVKEILEGE